MVKKKECKRGYSCGMTCISSTKACRKEFSDGVSVTLDNRSVFRGSFPVKVPAELKKDTGVYFKESLTKEEMKSLKEINKKIKNDDIFEDKADSALYEIFLTSEGKKILEDARKKDRELKAKAGRIVDSPDFPSWKETLKGTDVTIDMYLTAMNARGFTNPTEYMKSIISQEKAFDEEYAKLGSKPYGDEKALKKWDEDYEVLTKKYPAIGKPLWSETLVWGNAFFRSKIKNLEDVDSSETRQFLSSIDKMQKMRKEASKLWEQGDAIMGEALRKLDKAERPRADFKRTNVDPTIASRDIPKGEKSNKEDKKLQSLMDERVPMMTMDVKVFKNVLNSDEGRFKNVYEVLEDTGKKGGIAKSLTGSSFYDYLDKRTKKEEQMFGIPKDTDKKDRPVYGFMGNDNDVADIFTNRMGALGDYGNIVVQFKPQVKDRVTVTVDDSLGARSDNFQGSPANLISRESLPEKNLNKVNLNATSHKDIYEGGPKGDTRVPRYFEWQGSNMGVSDIESIQVPVNIWHQLSKKDQKSFEEKGIKVKLIAPRGISY